MEHYYFLQTQKNSRGSSLITLPNQELTSRTPLTAGIIVKGVDKLRHGYPVGTVFCSTTLTRCRGCYKTDNITPIISSTGERIHEFLYSEIFLDQYDKYLQQCRLI